MSGPGPTALITGGEGDLARAIAAELPGAGFSAVHCPGREKLDVTEPGSVSAFFAGLERLDLLVNNAAILHDARLVNLNADDWSTVVRTSLDGAFFCSRAAARLMVRQRCGHIVSIGSHSALDGPVGQTNYAAAKAGLIGLTKSLASEFGARNVRANCVLPGFLETKFTRAVIPERKAAVLGSQALGRFATVGDAARFITFLHGMKNVSGQVFQLDSRVGRW